MKKILSLFTLVLAVAAGTVAFDAEAKRLGGGKSSGMQRQNTTAPTGSNPTGAPAQKAPAAAPAAAAAGAQGAAAASKRSWMGPLAGIAAGLGLLALASHFGFGEALANMMLIGLLVMAGLMAFAFFMRKRAATQGASLAGAGMGQGARPAQDPLAAFRRTSQPESLQSQPAQQGSLIGSRIGSGLGLGLGAAAASATIPADFDASGFARNAKSQFLALQAANDSADFDKLAAYLSPDMLQIVRQEIIERGNETQETQVFGLEAQVLAVAQEDSRYVVSVRFTGSVRTEAGVAPDDLDEVWHLTKPLAGPGGWVIAGIEQSQSGN